MLQSSLFNLCFTCGLKLPESITIHPIVVPGFLLRFVFDGIDSEEENIVIVENGVVVEVPLKDVGKFVTESVPLLKWAHLRINEGVIFTCP